MRSNLVLMALSTDLIADELCARWNLSRMPPLGEIILIGKILLSDDGRRPPGADSENQKVQYQDNPTESIVPDTMIHHFITGVTGFRAESLPICYQVHLRAPQIRVLALAGCFRLRFRLADRGGAHQIALAIV